MNLNLEDRRVLVTGSTRGIGFGIAKSFVLEGAKVAISGRQIESVKTAVSYLSVDCKQAKTLECAFDLTDSSAIDRCLNKISDEWGGLDILILNLGSGKSENGLPDSTEWCRVINLNLIAAMETLRLSVRLLALGKQPAVVFVGSIAGLECLGAPIPYGSAKAALHHAMKASARYLAPSGIRVNMVAPGNVWFEGGTWARKMVENPTATKEMLDRHVPFKRFGTIDEIADCVLFLASVRASFVTGACMAIDGGQTCSY
jgi:3-oxoacyl-[acyl-carrier protein] reductase